MTLGCPKLRHLCITSYPGLLHSPLSSAKGGTRQPIRLYSITDTASSFSKSAGTWAPWPGGPWLCPQVAWHHFQSSTCQTGQLSAPGAMAAGQRWSPPKMSSRVHDEKRRRVLYYFRDKWFSQGRWFGLQGVCISHTWKELDHPQLTHDVWRNPGSNARWALCPSHLEPGH